MLQFSDDFKRWATDYFGIQPGHAIAAIEHPDQLEWIAPPGEERPVVGLYLKRINLAGKSQRILVGTGLAHRDWIVEWAWPILERTFQKGASPSTVLRRLCEEFGIPIRIGDRSGLLIISTAVDAPAVTRQGDVRRLEIATERGRRGAGTFYHKFDERAGKLLVVLAYLIDCDRLKAELESRGSSLPSK